MRFAVIIGLAILGCFLNILVRKESKEKNNLNDNYQDKEFAKFVSVLGEATDNKENKI